MNRHYKIIAQEMHLRDQQVSVVAALLEEGTTVPFIARYRKEVTGSLKDTTIAAVRDRIEKLAELSGDSKLVAPHCLPPVTPDGDLRRTAQLKIRLGHFWSDKKIMPMR